MEPAHAAVVAAHRGFYDSIETGDLDLMRALWLDSPGTVCVHPGGAPLRGTESILRSWALLMANVDYVQFFLTDMTISTRPAEPDLAEVAIVTCTENMLSDAAAKEADGFHGSSAVATHVLVKVSNGWRLWSRHTSTLVAREDAP